MASNTTAAHCRTTLVSRVRSPHRAFTFGVVCLIGHSLSVLQNNFLHSIRTSWHENTCPSRKHHSNAIAERIDASLRCTPTRKPFLRQPGAEMRRNPKAPVIGTTGCSARRRAPARRNSWLQAREAPDTTSHTVSQMRAIILARRNALPAVRNDACTSAAEARALRARAKLLLPLFCT